MGKLQAHCAGTKNPEKQRGVILKVIKTVILFSLGWILTQVGIYFYDNYANEPKAIKVEEHNNHNVFFIKDSNTQQWTIMSDDDVLQYLKKKKKKQIPPPSATHQSHDEKFRQYYLVEGNNLYIWLPDKSIYLLVTNPKAKRSFVSIIQPIK